MAGSALLDGLSSISASRRYWAIIGNVDPSFNCGTLGNAGRGVAGGFIAGGVRLWFAVPIERIRGSCASSVVQPIAWRIFATIRRIFDQLQLAVSSRFDALS